MARKPKPTALKLIQGNPGHRALNRSEPIPEGNLHDPPDWLTDSQCQIWLSCVADAPPGLLKRCDGPLLELYVTSLDIYRTACRMQTRLDATGTLPLLVSSPKVQALMQSPYLPIINRQAVILGRLAAEMGFTPTSRSRITLDGRGEDPDAVDLFGF